MQGRSEERTEVGKVRLSAPKSCPWRTQRLSKILKREDQCCRKITLMACEQARIKFKFSGHEEERHTGELRR